MIKSIGLFLMGLTAMLFSYRLMDANHEVLGLVFLASALVLGAWGGVTKKVDVTP